MLFRSRTFELCAERSEEKSAKNIGGRQQSEWPTLPEGQSAESFSAHQESLEILGSRGFELSFAPSEARKSPPRILADVSKANGRLCPKGKAPIPLASSILLRRDTLVHGFAGIYSRMFLRSSS